MSVCVCVVVQENSYIVNVLSLLTGNVVNGTIGKQMVDMLVESSNNVEMILKFFDMFLKLKDLTSSDTFKEYDPDGKGKALKTCFLSSRLLPGRIVGM